MQVDFDARNINAEIRCIGGKKCSTSLEQFSFFQNTEALFLLRSLLNSITVGNMTTCMCKKITYTLDV